MFSQDNLFSSIELLSMRVLMKPLQGAYGIRSNFQFSPPNVSRGGGSNSVLFDPKFDALTTLATIPRVRGTST